MGSSLHLPWPDRFLKPVSVKCPNTDLDRPRPMSTQPNHVKTSTNASELLSVSCCQWAVTKSSILCTSSWSKVADPKWSIQNHHQSKVIDPKFSCQSKVFVKLCRSKGGWSKVVMDPKSSSIQSPVPLIKIQSHWLWLSLILKPCWSAKIQSRVDQPESKVVGCLLERIKSCQPKVFGHWRRVWSKVDQKSQWNQSCCGSKVIMMDPCCGSKVVVDPKLLWIQSGSNVILNQKSSSIKSRPWSKVVLDQRSSIIIKSRGQKSWVDWKWLVVAALSQLLSQLLRWVEWVESVVELTLRWVGHWVDWSRWSEVDPKSIRSHWRSYLWPPFSCRHACQELCLPTTNQVSSFQSPWSKYDPAGWKGQWFAPVVCWLVASLLQFRVCHQHTTCYGKWRGRRRLLALIRWCSLLCSLLVLWGWFHFLFLFFVLRMNMK